MADKMRPVPFSGLLERIAGELRNHGSVFGIDSSLFYEDRGKKKVKVFSQECTVPVGPAAGPHTQLAQNIIAAYLEGARFIELKTVQIMDHLEIEKPCIDARDEGYNVEWSTEFTLEKAADEYIKAWIILHILEGAIKGHIPETPSFIFNASVGYNLSGIKEEKMQRFIDTMKDASGTVFSDYIAEAYSILEDNIFEGTILEESAMRIRKELDTISPYISPSVTISTMHGCPPTEIEAICSYMIKEKGFDTFVKLNPTLLGYDEVRRILDEHGFDYVLLKRKSFEHDLQLADALPMLHRLSDLASAEGRGFGVKLTNTLGTANEGEVLPGAEKYMSGRSLFPVSIRVASLLSEEFCGQLPISYSGGASALNAADIFECGIHPITIATDMLHPGGYTRMAQIASLLQEKSGWEMESIDLERLRSLVKRSDEDPAFRKSQEGLRRAKLQSPLPLTDCFVAPCVESCPIHQDIPDYIALAGEGRWAEAIGLIYLKNALPNITGWICDHQCQNHCTRLDYEGPVAIRAIKKMAAEKGMDEFVREIWEKPEKADVKAAVIGAGPAGLSAAFFLARAGFETSVFEKGDSAGGVVKNVIPEFRIPSSAVDKDVEFIKSSGVDFFFNTEKSVDELRREGFEYIFISIGAEKANDPGISGNGPRESAVSFLLKAKRGESISLGKHVAVIGGGNTAMDAARMAKRIPGVESVNIIYRRTESEMPADYEEYEAAIADGISFQFLSSPSTFTDGKLTVKLMELGEKDSSGRRRPVDTGRTAEYDIDYVISAIGEKADQDVLKAIASGEGEEDGVFIIGDASTGPSTVVRCIASARDAVDKAIDMVYKAIEEEDEDEDECECGHHHGDDCDCHHHDDECDCHHDDEEDDEEENDADLRLAEDRFFQNIAEKKSRLKPSVSVNDEFFARTEAKRCMECSYLCLKCVDVCPNRANIGIDLRETGLFEDPYQVLHIDAYCNECGNCATFCPHSGRPYKDKFTLFSLPEDFDNSDNSGFIADGNLVKIRLDGKIIEGEIGRDGELEADVPEEIKAIIEEIFLSYSYLLSPVEE